MSELSISRLQIEHLQNSLGIGTSTPRLSWQVETSLKNWQQTAYQVACFNADGSLREQTDRIESNQSVLVAWACAPLQSREQVSIKVRLWGTDESKSTWSEPLTIETGLLTSDDWLAQFITPSGDEDTSISNPCPYLRREFELQGEIKSARLYFSALGVYEVYLNGEVVGDHVLAPGWTVYDQRLRYQTFDVTTQMQSGQNAIGAILGDGWFRGRLGFEGGRRNIWGDKLALLAQLEIQYADGSTQHIISDENWHANTGAILTSSIYDGETYDARLEPSGWANAGI